MQFNSEFAESVFASKYLHEGEESSDQAVTRLDDSLSKYDVHHLKGRIYDYVDKQWFLPAGGIWRAAGNKSNKVSFVNCTSLEEPEDTLESIFHSLYLWAKFAAYGQGEGIDLSKLRPRGAALNNSARQATGAVSFMPIYDVVLKTIAQQGRRGASLISIHDTYPDLVEFIESKSEAGVLESANISIQTQDAFMEAVQYDLDWKLYWEDGRQKIEKVVKAKELFDAICEAAWKGGDPGLQFIDQMRRESNSDVLGFPIVSTNACSEQPLDPYNVCMLGHINLSKWQEFGDTGFEKLVEFGVRFLEACLEAEYLEERSPTKEQRSKLLSLPRIGLGVTGLADHFVQKQIRYGSRESIEEARNIFSKLTAIAYRTSHELAEEKGSFIAYDKSKYMQSEFVRRMLDEKVINESMLRKQRHVCKITIAPTGTASIIGECGGSGIEPIYSRYMVRRERATTGEWKEWFIFNPAVHRYFTERGEEPTREKADQLTGQEWATAYEVSAKDKVDLMSEIQKYVDSCISVTYNLTADTDVAKIKDLFLYAWQKKLKAITVYREGSREGVLLTERNYKQVKRNRKGKEHAPKRPTVLPAKVFHYNGYTMMIGFRNNQPYEIFGGKTTAKLRALKDGQIVKEGQGEYTIDKIDILKEFRDKTINTVTRLASLSLRHGVPIQFIASTLEKHANVVDITKFFARQLRKYIDGEDVLYSCKCGNCGSTDELKFENSCVGGMKCM